MRTVPPFLASTMHTLALLLLLVFTSTASAADEETILRTAKLYCKGTLYPSLCVSTLTAFPSLDSQNPGDLVSNASYVMINQVSDSQANIKNIQQNSKGLDGTQKMALDDCQELHGQTIDQLHSVIQGVSSPKANTGNDVTTLFSGSMTNMHTCLDGFGHTPKENSVRPQLSDQVNNISNHLSNGLVLSQQITVSNGSAPAGSANEPFEGYGKVSPEGFPAWLTRRDRRLLQAPAKLTNPDLVVAKDGSGNFRTISEAVEAAPNNAKTRFVIYIKAGVYLENVEVNKMKTNLMFIGDGIGKTVVKADRNAVAGWTTFRSATVAVVGNGFLARDLTIENFAGPTKYQAVALRSGSDHSAFYRCSFVGYRNTLYVHSLRQFYRECDVYGTVDFIFGDAAVVFQNCNLYVRKPAPNQKNIVTAQGRQDPNQNTGISIQRCKVTAALDLIPVRSSFQTYLGRPWGMYSRTVFMQSFLDDLIDPAGWLKWSGNFALHTLYYGEYMNWGPGSNTANRVTWPGYRVINSSTEASRFTVAKLIQGSQWLPATGIPFSPGL